MTETFTVTVTLVLKADTAQEAQKIAEEKCKLHEWFAEPPLCAPYPVRTLLWFRTEISDPVKAKTLQFIRDNPGCLAEDITVALRVPLCLRELELEGRIECRGGHWYCRESE